MSPRTKTLIRDLWFVAALCSLLFGAGLTWYAAQLGNIFSSLAGALLHGPLYVLFWSETPSDTFIAWCAAPSLVCALNALYLRVIFDRAGRVDALFWTMWYARHAAFALCAGGLAIYLQHVGALFVTLLPWTIYAIVALLCARRPSLRARGFEIGVGLIAMEHFAIPLGFAAAGLALLSRVRCARNSP